MNNEDTSNKEIQHLTDCSKCVYRDYCMTEVRTIVDRIRKLGVTDFELKIKTCFRFTEGSNDIHDIE